MLHGIMPSRTKRAKSEFANPFRFGAHGQDFFAAPFVALLHRHDRRFIADNALVFNVDEGIGGSEIYREIVRKDAEKGIQHQKTPSLSAKKRT